MKNRGDYIKRNFAVHSAHLAYSKETVEATVGGHGAVIEETTGIYILGDGKVAWDTKKAMGGYFHVVCVTIDGV
jgi:hypothetical protein